MKMYSKVVTDYCGISLGYSCYIYVIDKINASMPLHTCERTRGHAMLWWRQTWHIIKDYIKSRDHDLVNRVNDIITRNEIISRF